MHPQQGPAVLHAPGCSASPTELQTACMDRLTAAGELVAIWWAISSAVSISWSARHDLVDHAELVGPLGWQRNDLPQSVMPQRRSERQALGEADVLDRAHHADVHMGVEEDGVSAATTMSASTTKWNPAPATMPFTAVTVGFHTRFWRGDQWTSSLSGPLPARTPPRDATAPRSAPVQKWRSPVAGDDRAADPRVVADLGPDRLDRLDHAPVQRVAPFRAVDPDVGDVVALLVDEPLDRSGQVDSHGHAPLPLSVLVSGLSLLKLRGRRAHELPAGVLVARRVQRTPGGCVPDHGRPDPRPYSPGHRRLGEPGRSCRPQCASPTTAPWRPPPAAPAPPRCQGVGGACGPARARPRAGRRAPPADAPRTGSRRSAGRTGSGPAPMSAVTASRCWAAPRR